MKPLVRWLMNKRYAVKIADSLYIGKYAGTYHERQHVHSNEKRGANGKRNEHSKWNFCVWIQLNLDHRHLKAIS